VANPVNEFLRNKKQEWEEYRSEVTPFELRKNLKVLKVQVRVGPHHSSWAVCGPSGV
jgi:glutamine synthetase